MHIGRLILIAGPSVIGKSFFINLLKSGDLKKFSEQLGIMEPNLWNYLTAKEVREMQTLEVKRLIFHYDLTGPWKRSLQSGFIEDYSLEILNNSKEIIVVTLWAKPEIILKRYLTRQRESKNIIRLLHRLVFPAKEIKLYNNSSKLLILYREWYEFCGKFNLKAHWIVNTMSNPITYESFNEPSC